MKRGEIYWVDLDPTIGGEIKKTRPCVVLSVNPINKVRRTVVVVPLTSKGVERLPLVVYLESAKGYAVCDQLRAVSKTTGRIRDKFGELTLDDLEKLGGNLRIVLGLSAPTV